MSDIEKYKQNRAVRESTIPRITISKEEAQAYLDNIDNPDKKSDKVPDPNNNPAYYYTTIRIAGGHLAIKIRVSLIAYLAIVTSTAPDRRSVKKLLYKILKDFKKPKGTTNIQNLILDKIIDHISKTTGEGIDDYEGYCAKLGGAALGNEE